MIEQTIDRRRFKGVPSDEVQATPGLYGDSEENYSALVEAETAPVEAESLIQSADVVYDNPVPIFDRILVRRMAKEANWNGTKIVIPESAQKSPNRGVVIATSEFYIVEGKQFPMADLVRQGDLVVFGAFNVDDVEVDGEIYGLLTIFDVRLIQKRHYVTQGLV